ncbi:D-inositol-3-phosphate glycosyltransferase [subsurface metagenome]
MRVLISAYACEPHKGSEPGVGWNWVKQIAKFAEAWVITRINNREVIEEELRKNPILNLHFVYVDLPKWLRFWKKKQRGVHLYYYLWQFAVYLKARVLAKELKFDIVHHITFVNDWMPSFLAMLSVPFVWGPIGSHQPIPKFFLPDFRSKLLEFIRISVQNTFRCFDFFFGYTLSKAKIIITINSKLQQKYPFRFINGGKFVHQPAIGINIDKQPKYMNNKARMLRIISAGRLIYFKGFHLALHAFTDGFKTANGTHFTIIGDGMEKRKLENLAVKLCVKDKVTFVGNISRIDVLARMQESDIFLFPSFEGGGMVVLEAMASRLPVVCLDFGGPGEMITDECGIKVKPITPEQTITELADALLKLANDSELRKRMGEVGSRRTKEVYSWDKKGEFIRKVYVSVLKNESSYSS